MSTRSRGRESCAAGCRAGPRCRPKASSTRDKSTAADGISKIKLSGGPLGKGNVQIIGKNTASTLPRGIAASLQSQSGATIQLLTSDASCFGTALTRVKKANGAMFSAVGP